MRQLFLSPFAATRAYPIQQYPAKCQSAAAIMHMIMNNLDPAVAQVGVAVAAVQYYNCPPIELFIAPNLESPNGTYRLKSSLMACQLIQH